MRVLVDMSYARRGPSGTAVYVERLLPELAALGVTVIETAPRSVWPRGGGGVRSLANLGRQLLWTSEELRRRARAAEADVVHHPLPAFSRRIGVPQVITVHDLAFELLPSCFDPRFARWASRAHRRAARQAGAVICPSEATAADVERVWGVVDRVVVAPHGPGQAPRPDRGAPRHFLYVGDDEPRKNLDRLLAAYMSYRASAAVPLDLVLAGSAERTAPGVCCVREPDLQDLHRHAAALVLVSLHEGFGLPALEAMHAGTPVLASRGAGALEEVCGEAALFVDARDVEAIASALGDLATVGPLREELRRRGTRRAEAFSWRASAEAHARAYALAVA